MISLHARVALAAGAVLVAFVVLTSAALEQAFRDSARAAREERLLGQIYLLMGAADPGPEGRLALPDSLAEARFAVPGSGLYGTVTESVGTVWTSHSALGVDVPFHRGLQPGERILEQRNGNGGRAYLVESFGVAWELPDGRREYTFSVAEDLAAFEAEIAHFRASLAWALAAMAALLLAALALALRWGLVPLRHLAADIGEVQAGRRERLEGPRPRELQPLADSLNSLLDHERARQRRLENGLADLAHSLKTPLAVTRGLLAESPPDERRRGMEEQIDRMGRAVDFHLQRAAAGAGSALGPRLPIAPAARRVAASLAKVYAGRPVEFTVDVPEGAMFRGAEGELMELLGNLLDNAWKWCRGKVRVSAETGGSALALIVEDDGPGIDPAESRRLLERGARADESVPGHGIGLAVVKEIAESRGGQVAVDRGALGGARVRVTLGDSAS